MDSEGEPIAGAVVQLEADNNAAMQPSARATIDQRDATFIPQVTVIGTGTEVEFPNSDAVSHHVYSFARPNAFELPLYKGQSRPTVRFDHPGIVTLGCNIHDSMLGYIVVVDTPYFGITDADGHVSIAVPPTLDQEVLVWSPRLDPGRAVPTEIHPVMESNTMVTAQVSNKLRRAQAPSSSLAWQEY